MKQEITIPKGTEKISIEQFDNRIVIELIQKFKYEDGDVVFEDGRIMIFKSLPNNFHAFFYPKNDTKYFDGIYGEHFTSPTFRLATDSEKQQLFNALAKEGKRWNAEKKCIEDIPVYKDGDFVVGIGCIFILHTQIDKQSAQYHVLYEKTNGMLHYGKTYSQLCGTDRLRLATETEKQELLDALAKEGKGWNTEKKCIEALSQKPKVDSLAIFWDFASKYSVIRVFKKMEDGRYVDSTGGQWHNCIPFKSEDQFIEHIKIRN